MNVETASSSIKLIANLVSENNLKSLLEKTLLYIQTQFTVTKCAYITAEEEENYVTVFSKNGNVEFFVKQQLQYFNQIPVTPIQIAINERKNISLTTLEDLLFNVEESYYTKEHPKSIACFSLIYDNTLQGVIYCENSKKETIYTRKSLTNFLDLQPIISYAFNNALLLSEKNRAIATKNKELQLLERKIVDVQKEKETALDELKKLSVIVRETDNAIMIFDCNWDLEWVNNSFLKLYGYTKGDFIETYGANLLENSNTKNIKEKIADCINYKKSAIIEIINYKRSGEKMWIQRTLSPIFNNRLTLEKFVAIDIDITKLKQAQEAIKEQNEQIAKQHKQTIEQRDELKEQSLQLIKAFKKNSNQAVKMQIAIEQINNQNSALEKARIEADRANAEKSIFLANMSHEIRTPLNGILGMTNMLMKTQLTPTQLEFAELIKESASSLSGIVDNILDISKIEAGKIENDITCFNLEKLIRSVINPIKLKALEKNIELHYNKQNVLPKYIKSDALKLKQIIANLLNNAIKFTDYGSIQFEIEAELKAENKTEIKIRVTDTGIGIADEKIKHIIEPFAQADSSTTRKYGGTGLGLSISKQLIELLGGKLYIQSTINKGSTFWFTILCQLPSLQEIETQKNKDDEIKNSALPQLSALSILIAEDNLINQKYITSLLDIHKIKNTVASNGQEAIEQLKNETYDCILMDMHMPEMNGIEATKQIRKNAATKHIPIIALSAAAYKHDEKEMFNAGANFFISKPIDEDTLITILAKIKDGNLEQTKIIGKNIPGNAVINKEAFKNYFKSFDNDFIASIIHDFKKSSNEKMNRISAFLNNKEYNMLKLEAHSLKGELSIFCANKAEKAIKELEEIETNKNTENIDKTYQHAKQCINELIDELKNYTC